MSGFDRDRKAPDEPLAAIILVAGLSSRMGTFKPLLPVGSATAIESAIDAFLNAGITGVTVVTGYRAPDLRSVIERKGVHEVFNAGFEAGMYSSIVAGVRSLAPDVPAAFVLPADIPLVRPRTIELLATSFRETPAPVIYPVFQARRGHPPLVSGPILRQALVTEPHDGLRGLLARCQNAARHVDVIDEGIHLDMDTPDDLVRLRELASQSGQPSEAECEAILATAHSGERIVRHSRAVAALATSIATDLIARGFPVNIRLVRAGALLHDICKGQPQHAAEGAALVRRFGFNKVAEVIASHTDFDFQAGLLNEAAIVYLADKSVSGETHVSIEHHFEPALLKYRDNPEAAANILRRRATAERIARAVQATAGRDPAS